MATIAETSYVAGFLACITPGQLQDAASGYPRLLAWSDGVMIEAAYSPRTGMVYLTARDHIQGGEGVLCRGYDYLTADGAEPRELSLFIDRVNDYLRRRDAAAG